MPPLENTSVPRKPRPALLIAGALLILAVLFLLALLIHGAETIFSKIRYTSICSRCGLQTAADFYYLFDSELAQAEQILPISRKTLMPAQKPALCAHEYFLVGKTFSSLALNGAFTNHIRGQPFGDSEFEKAEIKNAFLELSLKNPNAATAYLQALAKDRYRARPLRTSPGAQVKTLQGR